MNLIDGDVATLKESLAISGISLRDYFAGQALIALISLDNEESRKTDVCAYIAYQYADAMLYMRDDTKEGAK